MNKGGGQISEREPGYEGATTQNANKKEERDKQRGLTDLSGVCTCEGNRQMGQVKEKRDRYMGRKSTGSEWPGARLH